MCAKVKTEVLTDEEKYGLKLKEASDYVVRFTNDKNDVLYVSIKLRGFVDKGIHINNVVFRLWDSKLAVLDGASVYPEESLAGYMAGWCKAKPEDKFPASKVIRAAGKLVGGDAKQIYRKAAMAVAKVAEKREELKAKQWKTEEKARREQSPVLKVVRDFFGR